MPVDIAVISSALRALGVLAKRAGNIDLYNQIINMQQTVLELVSERLADGEKINGLTQEVVALQQKIAGLEGQLSLRDEMSFKDGAYWRVRRDRPEEGPLCARCFDQHARLARMRDVGNGFTCCVVFDYCIGHAQYRGPVPI